MRTKAEKELEGKVHSIDNELLLTKCENLVLKLSESRKAWEMSVPAFKYDSDIILMELIRRHRNIIEQNDKKRKALRLALKIISRFSGVCQEPCVCHAEYTQAEYDQIMIAIHPEYELEVDTDT